MGKTLGARLWDAVIFDCDGVILESADVKTRAFAELFRGETRWRKAIVAYHVRNAGLSRFRKFEYIYKRFLKRPLTGDEKLRLGRRFSRLALDGVLSCPLVPGVRRLLKMLAGKVPLFVVSGTPERELRRVLRVRGLAPAFDGVYGSPRTKDDLIRGIVHRCGLDRRRTLYVGDAANDRRAARAAGVHFLARVARGKASPFPAGTPTVRDLRRLPAPPAAGGRRA